MIELVAGDPVPAAPGYFVAASGTFHPEDLVPCSLEPGGPAVVAFLAQFIATGENDLPP